jgi:beta-glucosidase
MNSYADVDGVPAATSPQVLQDLLRETLGFTGFVSSDYGTTNHIVTRQRAARTPAEAGRLTIAAGLDTEFPTPSGYGHALATEVEEGRVDLWHVDASVRRILTAKFALELFEIPIPPNTSTCRRWPRKVPVFPECRGDCRGRFRWTVRSGRGE